MDSHDQQPEPNERQDATIDLPVARIEIKITIDDQEQDDD